MHTRSLFATKLHMADVSALVNLELVAKAIRKIESSDAVGRAWSAALRYDGYSGCSTRNKLYEETELFREIARLVECEAQSFGRLMMWESWLRHEVLPGEATCDRLTITFDLA